MTDLFDLPADELRHELDQARDMTIRLVEELLTAIDSGDWAWAAGVAATVKPAVARVKRVRNAIRSGAAA